MLFSVKHREDSGKINDLVSIQDQVKASRSQEKLGKQNFHEDVQKVLEPVTKTNKHAYRNVTSTMTESSKENNKALSILSDKLSELINDRGILAS